METVTEEAEVETNDVSRPISELEAELADVGSQIKALDAEYTGKRFAKGARQQWNDLHEREKDLTETIDELKLREADIAERAGKGSVEESIDTFQTRRPGSVTGDNIYDLSRVRRLYDDPTVEGKQLRDRALKAIDGAEFPHERADKVDQKATIARMLGKEPQDGRFSRYLLTHGSPAYKRAFMKTLTPTGMQLLTRDEQDSLVSAEAAERAMSLTTTSGGFAVPFVLDPTIIQTGSGAINPYRDIGNVINITVDEWRGVSSDGVTAAFAAEAAVATDASPTLAQPVVSTEKAFAFIPFSIEIGMDWGAFASEMAGMVQDAKDVLEATKFALGSGTNEPFGVITGATTVFTASNTNALVVADIYGVHNALGPRFRRNAKWTLNNAVADRIRQLDTAGGANLWIQNLQLRSAAVPNGFTDGRMGADLLGKPAYEATAQSGTFTTGQLIGVIGDYSYYKIADRIGMQMETIPHIFGAAQGNLPTGQRGLYCYWRVGAKVLHANAFRTLKLG
jgi:HK97 family phage major capsid protein